MDAIGLLFSLAAKMTWSGQNENNFRYKQKSSSTKGTEENTFVKFLSRNYSKGHKHNSKTAVK